MTAADAKFIITDLQMGLELLLKFRLVRDRGLNKILASNRTARSDIAEIKSGAINTLGFGKCLETIMKIEDFSPYELGLLKQFQTLRNAVVHFGADVDPKDILVAASHLVLKPLQCIVYGTHPESQFVPRGVPIAGPRESYIDQQILCRLIRFPPYVEEAERDAQASDGFGVELCWACSNRTLVVQVTDDLYCFCCGETSSEGSVGWADCFKCGKPRGVVFDALNEQDNVHTAKCLDCGCREGILVCPACDYVGPSHFCGTVEGYDGLVCFKCSQMISEELRCGRMTPCQVTSILTAEPSWRPSHRWSTRRPRLPERTTG